MDGTQLFLALALLFGFIITFSSLLIYAYQTVHFHFEDKITELTPTEIQLGNSIYDYQNAINTFTVGQTCDYWTYKGNIENLTCK